VPFEQMLARDGIEIRKYYLDITKKEQKKRLDEREDDPLTQWKVSPIDEMAQKKWSAYSRARDEMLRRTSHEAAPWHVVLANDKKVARLEFIRDLLDSFAYPGKSRRLTRPDRSIVFPWSPANQEHLAP
jgi:polyphosphate kinase 2 (PPK2 family)